MSLMILNYFQKWKGVELVFIEWTGSIIGLIGALLLALNNDWSKYGFVVFLLSNVCWVLYGYKTNSWGMLVMQMGFTIISAYGIYSWA